MDAEFAENLVIQIGKCFSEFGRNVARGKAEQVAQERMAELTWENGNRLYGLA